MKPVSGKRMAKLDEAKGWLLIRVNSSHRVDSRPGSPLNVIVPVHGNRDLRTGTQRSIMRDAGLTDADL